MVLLPSCEPAQCGRDLRDSLRKPSPILTSFAGKKRKPRIVPAFTIQAMQKNTKVKKAPKCGAFNKVPAKPSQFRDAYTRGDVPLSIGYTSGTKSICWRVAVEDLDFHHYLPLFFDGIVEAAYPFNFIVEKGIKDLCTKGGHKILPVVPQIIMPMKKALNTRDPRVVCQTLTCIQQIVTGCDKVGEALVPYYRQLLPVLNTFKLHNRKNEPTDQIKPRNENVYGMIDDTLQILEQYGGPDAFINIKYMVPTYESGVMN